MNTIFSVLPALLLVFACSNMTTQHSNNGMVASPPQDSPRKTSFQVTLPDSATAFIQQHFAPETLKRVTAKKSPTAKGTFYEARLTNDTEIDFGKAGNWIEVKAEEPNQLPLSFFPEAIRIYLEANFAGTGVESIDKDATGYELELTNDINLHFDAQGAFIRQEK